MSSRQQISVESTQIPGVRVLDLVTHDDQRGDFTELFRQQWFDTPQPVQWSMIRSKANTLRGMHVHVRHSDYLTLPQGEVLFGMFDLRKHSPTFRNSLTLRFTQDQMRLLYIPPGVGHAFYFPVDSIIVCSATHYFDSTDDLPCRWDDQAMGLFPDIQSPILSDRDALDISVDQLLQDLEPYQDGFL